MSIMKRSLVPWLVLGIGLPALLSACSGDDTATTTDAGYDSGGGKGGSAGKGGASGDASVGDAAKGGTTGVGGATTPTDGAAGAGGTTGVGGGAVGTGGSVDAGPDQSSPAGGSQNTGGSTPTDAAPDTTTPDTGVEAGAGGSNAGGSNAGGSNAGGSNAGGSNAGGSNAGGSNTGGTNAGGSNAGGSTSIPIDAGEDADAAEDAEDAGDAGDAAEAGPPPNLITNSSFEDATSDWGGWNNGGVAPSTEKAHTGLQSLKGTTLNDGSVAKEIYTLLSVGHKYTASAWINVSTSQQVNWQTVRRCDSDTADQYPMLQQANATADTWQFFTGTIDLTASQCTGALTKLIIYAGAASGDVYLDDVSVTLLE